MSHRWVPIDLGGQSDDTIDLSTRPPLILFVHIPKTAGTAVRNILSVNEIGRPRESLLWNVFKGGGGVNLSLYEKLHNGERPRVRRFRMVRGHFPLGVRDYMPPLVGEGRELRYLTFLRDPVDRMLSHFFHVVDKHAGAPDPNQGKELGLSPLPAQPTLEEAIAGGYLHDNLQTRMLSGIPEPFGEVTEETLERAKQNLRDPHLVFGLTERFDESLVLIKRRFGLRCILSHASQRINTARPRGRGIPVELVRTAEDSNRYDVELYRYARELFDAEPDLSEPDFEAELAGLRAARGTGPVQNDQPPPAGFNRPPELWRERVAGIAQTQRLEWEVGELRSTVDAVRAKNKKLEEDLGERSKAYELELARTEALEAKLNALKSSSLQQIAHLRKQLAAARAEVRGEAGRKRNKAKPAPSEPPGQRAGVS